MLYKTICEHVSLVVKISVTKMQLWVSCSHGKPYPGCQRVFFPFFSGEAMILQGALAASQALAGSALLANLCFTEWWCDFRFRWQVIGIHVDKQYTYTYICGWKYSWSHKSWLNRTVRSIPRFLDIEQRFFRHWAVYWSGVRAMVPSCSVVLTFVACFAAVFAFNLDIKDPFVYEGSSGEYFGYTVALHAQQNGDNW